MGYLKELLIKLMESLLYSDDYIEYQSDEFVYEEDEIY